MINRGGNEGERIRLREKKGERMRKLRKIR